MVVSFFNDGVSGDKMVLPGDTRLSDSDLLDWRDAFAAYMQTRLNADGLDRVITGAKVSVISTDRWLLQLQVAWPDGRSAVSRHTVLFARFQCEPGYLSPRIVSLGNASLTQQ